MPTTTPPPTTARLAYLMAQHDAQALLAQLSAVLDGHAECAAHGPISREDVDDIEGIVTQLQTILGDMA